MGNAPRGNYHSGMSGHMVMEKNPMLFRVALYRPPLRRLIRPGHLNSNSIIHMKTDMTLSQNGRCPIFKKPLLKKRRKISKSINIILSNKSKEKTYGKY